MSVHHLTYGDNGRDIHTPHDVRDFVKSIGLYFVKRCLVLNALVAMRWLDMGVCFSWVFSAIHRIAFLYFLATKNRVTNVVVAEYKH